MSNRDWRSVLFWAVIIHISTLASLAPGAASTQAPRVIDDRDRVALHGNVHPMARSQYEVGRAKAELPMERMILSLARHPEVQERLERLLAAQHDPQSPLYHQWLTPEEFGTRFGPSKEDLETVKTWLTGQGFKIDEVAKGRGWINFSGTASQVERAFSTEIHDYKVDGKIRHANAMDISIPRGLTDLVQGVVTLHNFPLQTAPVVARKVSKEELTEKYTATTGDHFLAPADFATIYNLNSLYSSGIDGTGRVVTIAGRTDINLSDVQFFRSFFGLPVNDPTIIHNGPAPGNLGGNEELAADLSVQWAGAVARNAATRFVVSKSTATTDGSDLSAQYIVDNNLGTALNMGFSECESDMGLVEQKFYNNLWSQAVSQGITVFAASGSAGAAGCNSGGDTTGSGVAVSGMCSTPYSVCVGGTQFNDTASPGTYWSGTNDPTTQASALSYIPEIAWNESATSGGANLWATGGGASTLYPKPVWQSALGVPADGKRDVPDVSLAAAGHVGYMIFQGHSTGTTGLIMVRGTDAASSAFAGLMTLIVQKVGQRQGNANEVLYPMAASQYAGTGPTIFHDITSGNNTVPGVTGFSCTAGYDQVTGLGSIDGAALVNNWPIVPVPFRLPGSVNTTTPPSTVSVNGTTFVFYKGFASDPGIYVTQSIGSLELGNWTNAVHLPLSVNTSDEPSSVVMGNTIYVAYKGAGSDPSIYVLRSFDSAATWSATQLPSTVGTSVGPNAYVYEGVLYVVFKGAGGDANIYVAPVPASSTWTPI